MDQPPRADKSGELTTVARLALAIGATVAGLGLAVLVSVTNHWYHGSGHVSARFLWLAAVLALVAAAGLWAWPLGRSRALWRTRRLFVQAALVVAAALLGLFGLVILWDNVKEMAYGASMRSDLRALVAVEQQHFADSGTYTSNVDAFYAVSPAVLGPQITLTADGWTASVRHRNSPRTCAIFVGTTSLAPAVREREPTCTRLPFPRSGFFWGLAFY